MSTFTLVLPGLLWPNARGAHWADGVATPGWDWLLGHSQIQRTPAQGLDAWMAAQYELLPEEVSWAQARYSAEKNTPPGDGGEEWICLDPAHLRFAREQMMVMRLPPSSLTLEQAQNLAAVIAPAFETWGVVEVTSPTHWYLKLSRPCRAAFVPLGAAQGKNLTALLPQGEDALAWQHMINEAQILLHNALVHPFAESDATIGVNTLWPWGNRTKWPSLGGQAKRGQKHWGSDSLIFEGLAQQYGDAHQRLSCWREKTPVLPTVLQTSLYAPTIDLDPDAWGAALAKLEQDWFAPVAQALKRGDLGDFEWVVPSEWGGFQGRVGAWARWQFWKKPRRWGDILKTWMPRMPG